MTTTTNAADRAPLGRLTPCPNKPNCVSSQEATDDKQHYFCQM